MSGNVIEIERVTKSFGGVVANHEISLSVPKGKITGLIGPNGSGKTTLFNSIVGYHPIDSGSIRFKGREISKLNVQKIARLGLLRTFQQTRIYGKLDCMQNMLMSIPHRNASWIDMFAKLPRATQERAEQLLEFVGLFAKRRLLAGSLSFGQQKLLEFAMALMNEPEVLMLDEPTAGINPTLINGLIERLRRANTEFGITMFVIEHNMRVIMNMADSIYCLAHGELLAHGTPDKIRNDQTVIDAYLGAHLMSEKRSVGYHTGDVETVISVEEVNRQAMKLGGAVTPDHLAQLAHRKPYVLIEGLSAGYGKMEILHDFHLEVARGQALCLIGPNGAGKSTILHSIFGFTRIFGGRIQVGEGAAKKDITRLNSSQKLREAGIAYILQDKSVFPNMTVEENLWMGGYLLDKPALAKERADKVFAKYDRLAARRKHPARVLSGGERRLLEISRALVMEPEVLLVDEPSIGLEPRFIDMVFEILEDLQKKEGKTIIMVEQNAKRGLEFCDIGYVLVSGQIALAASGKELLENPEVGRLFLGG